MAFKRGMNQKSNNPNFDQESATERLTNDIAKSFREHFQLDEKHADWKANLLIEMAESCDFINEIVEERDSNEVKEEDPLDQIPNPNTKFAKVDRMECLFTKAFAEAFDLTEDEASGPLGMMMELLENSLFTEELMREFPVTAEDLVRLGVPLFVNPEPSALESEPVPEGKSLLAGLRKLPLD